MKRTAPILLVPVLALVVIAGLLQSGCRAFTSYRDERATVDSLQQVVKQLDRQFGEIDFTTVEAIRGTVTMELDSVLTLCKTHDTYLTKEEGVFFGRYRDIMAPVRKAGTDRESLQREIDLAKKQLADLKTDLDNKALSKEQAQLYINQELLAVKSLQMSLNKFASGSEHLISRFREMRKEVNERIQALHQRIATSG